MALRCATPGSSVRAGVVFPTVWRPAGAMMPGLGREGFGVCEPDEWRDGTVAGSGRAARRGADV
jgi:hypothetical protein